ncbi:hypothetical protein BDP55DRAFT_759728 [Colletotrichum godetiae]|uniref:J domain-containing protein n=1 Tax=Colletotrichum godetiae TaxID=1209918 RepID=A0AAJ0AS79_9PEZI|nr:uncharacterized protein BDP55DRAFT_759728 [Colletotrichum godetiae]KAK1689414.1 hypothetical protein BDP55DRAFT_759728 [Colletotrichum godetiae]
MIVSVSSPTIQSIYSQPFKHLSTYTSVSSASSAFQSFHLVSYDQTDPPMTPTDYYSVLGIRNDATQEHIEEAFHGIGERFCHHGQHELPSKFEKYPIGIILASSSKLQISDGTLINQSSIHHPMQITKAYEVLSDPLQRARYDKSRQSVVKAMLVAKSLRLRKFSAWDRESKEDLPSAIAMVSVKQKLKEKLKKGKNRLNAALETTAHKAKEAEARRKSRWLEVLATPQKENFYQQPTMPQPQLQEPQNEYYAEENSETLMSYEDFDNAPKDYQLQNRAAIDFYTRDSHNFNEATEPREVKMPSLPNKARLSPLGRQPICIEDEPHGWKGWYPTNNGHTPPGCPICENFDSKFFCTRCNATSCMMCRLT